MFQKLTTVSQGNVGLGSAIGYFCSKNYVVSIPLNDNQSYDLVVDFGHGPKTIQVKTTRYKDRRYNKSYLVQLKHVHANRTKIHVRNFDNSTVDFLYVLTEEGTKYLFPSTELTAVSSLTLSDKYDRYKLECHTDRLSVSVSKTDGT